LINLSNQSSFLDSDILYLKGVGPVKADLLKKELAFHTARDVLFDYPTKHVDRSSITKIRDINAEGIYVQLQGYLKTLELIGSGRTQRLSGIFKDETGEIEFVWFRSAAQLARMLELNIPMLAYGRVSMYQRKYNIAHPELESASEGSNQMERILPVYRSTEKLNNRGIDNRVRRTMVQGILNRITKSDLPDHLPESIITKLRLMPYYQAIREIHFPENQQNLLSAEKRLKFDELFLHQLKMMLSQKVRQKESGGYVFELVGEYFNQFYHTHLPFELTSAQKKVLKEIRRDLSRPIQMNRLLQGDVGSGKTIVALMSMLIAIDNGYQCCMMAPTEILASQHYQGISPYLTSLGLNASFLSGNVKGKTRKKLLEELKSGDIHILIGTHAVLEDPVVFKQLGYVIIDEQHRFGVAQRARLWNKAKPHPPHVLVMTATPIPRTLAMTIYGDLDVSVIDELPPGRKLVKTVHKTEYYRPDLIKFMKSQIAEGRQIYVVYPLIEESETLDLENLQNGYEKLLHRFAPPDYQISIVHGKLRQEDKEFEMQRFVRGETNIMVATTVIEVGVNVPNASVMIIENAERFGLSQLHQLRGRVGRGADQSYCVLMTSYKISHEGRIRLETMCETNDGFKIAEVDLQLRGPGAIEGTQQSGLPDFKIANIARDGEIISAARVMARELLEADPTLSTPANLKLQHYVRQHMRDVPLWSKIS
jgi:ATP-dependent DNA helicase RecG